MNFKVFKMISVESLNDNKQLWLASDEVYRIQKFRRV